MRESVAETMNAYLCRECGEQITNCCDCNHRFIENELMWCNYDGKFSLMDHLCYGCGLERKKDEKKNQF